VIPPLGFLGVFVASLDVEGVVGWSFFVGTRGEHGDDGETNGLDGESGRPVVRQDRKADVTVAIDVGMDGHVGPEEDDDGRVEGIPFGEFEGELEEFAVVESRGGSFEIDRPLGQIAARFVGVDGDARRRIRAQIRQFLLQAPFTRIVRSRHDRR